METNRVLFIHCLILSLLVMTATAIDISTEQQALLALKAHITDDPTNFLAKNWNTSSSVCNWMGVTCDVHSHRITALNISSLSLTGTIPTELGNLSSLKSLDLSFNRLSGAFPSSIFNMSSLLVIDFSNITFSGQLPPNICHRFPNLETMILKGNMFHGEIPSTLSNCRQLRKLSLSSNDFLGTIPKEIGNLTMLELLFLRNNKLQGTIPSELGSLSSLQTLDFSSNQLLGTIPSSIFMINTLKILDLSSNQLSGSFPSFNFNVSFLQVLDLYDNRLSGELPANIFKYFPFLEFLSFQFNKFTGRLPRDIGNLTSLTFLDGGDNNLTGEIPHEIGNLRNLEVLQLQSANLVGVVPAAIFNISTLKALFLYNNTLSGTFSPSMDHALPNLEVIGLEINNFSGSIPSFVFNASKLSILELGDNSFTGFVPDTFHNLRSLKILNLQNNYFTSSTPDMSFLSSLANCKNLKTISLTENPLDGVLPSSIGNLSISLEKIFLHNCNIRGSIPEEMANLINMTTLRLGNNKLNGSIPVTLDRLQNLRSLGLENNKLEGRIPNELCHLSRISFLFLNNNRFYGPIPACLGKLTSLRELSFASNELTSIPSTFWNLGDILTFDFSANSLNGSLPLEIGNLKAVVEIFLSRNNLSGDIPATIGGLKNLQTLSLEYNGLQGSIPKSFGDLVSLESLDLSNNNLSGVIPVSLEKLLYLKDLNLSFNRLEGEIPRGGVFVNFSANSFMGNDLLCGSPNLQVPSCKSSTHRKSRKKFILLGVVLPLISIAFIITITLALRFKLISRFRKRSTRNIEANMSPQVAWRKFSYQELLRATDRFSANNLIGSGSFSSVYKGRFLDGMEVAIKVFHLQLDGALKSFYAECEVLRSIRHRNLLKIISSCTNDDFKALVLEYMPKGSLEDWLYSENLSLDIFQRLSIVIDIALALEYLHISHSNPVVHCDIKPSNVLLDENMTAHLSDFGIAKLLSGEESKKHTQTLATIGYIAPEYGREGQVSTKGDMYSFGILLMEIFSRKKPTNEFFSGEMSLKQWVNDSLPISVMNVVDPSLLRRGDDHFVAKEICVSSILSLAVECTSESPEERINAKETLTSLLKIRDTFLANLT